MAYQQCLPAVDLRESIAAYWAVDEGAMPFYRVLPDGCADLICDLAAPAPQARWVGTMTRALVLPSLTGAHLFGVRFRAGALFSLLGAPLALLTDTAVDLRALPARHWRPPLTQWRDASDFSARCRLADQSLRQALAGSEASDLLPLLRLLEAAAELPGVAALVLASGYGSRTLQRRFLGHLGVTLRQHLRYLRFERARCLLERGLPSLTVALAAGFSDQAHFVREFQRFAGTTPGRWR